MAERTRQSMFKECNAYLEQRTGTYAFRCQRYKSVLDQMRRMGFQDGDLVVDVGAGRCEFDRYMHEQVAHPRYLPIDGSIDGTNLEVWKGEHLNPEFFVCIEILEHLEKPSILMVEMMMRCKKGIISTTPNPETVDVMAIDPTHKTPLPKEFFQSIGWSTAILSHFGKPNDSILSWWRKCS